MTKIVKFGELKHGSLMGYSTHLKAQARREILVKLLDFMEYKTLMEKLVAIEVLNKNRAPVASKKIKMDIKWLQKAHKIVF
jgi:hypothetical protein